MPRIIYPRLTRSLLAFLFLILAILFIFVEVGLIGYAFNKLGFPPSLAVLLLLLSLLGSHVNIPIRTIVSLQPIFTGTEVVFYVTLTIVNGSSVPNPKGLRTPVKSPISRDGEVGTDSDTSSLPWRWSRGLCWL